MKQDIVTGFMSAIITILLIMPFMIFYGFVLQKLWGWFISSYFHLAQLTLLEAVGLALVTGLLTHTYAPKKEGDTWGPITDFIFYPILCLAFGAIIFHLMGGAQ